MKQPVLEQVEVSKELKAKIVPLVFYIPSIPFVKIFCL